MIRTLLIIAVVALAAFTAGPLAAAQNQADQPAAAGAIDDGFNQLRDRFMRLVRSIQNKGSIDEQDKPLFEAMMNRVAAYRTEHTDDIRALAMEAQLAVMLKDDDRVFDLFDQLMQRDSDNAQLAQDWLRYFQSQDETDHVKDVIDRLVEIGPDNQAIRRVVAEHLRQSMQYEKAIEFLQGVELDPENNPEAIILLSDALFAEHRFQESLDQLNRIPESALEQNRQLRGRVNSKKPDRERYVDYWQTEQQIRSEEAAADDLPRAEIIVKDRGRILVELFENQAPNTVANFITLAEDGFYNGTTFHRVLANFMAQGGDVYSKTGEGTPGTGNPGYYIPDEHTRDDHRMHFSGSLSMAKTAQPNTAGSQFYITFEPTPWLNGQHTVFGRVLEGLDVARSIKQGDEIEAINILRKRDHEYTVQKIPVPGSTPAAGSDNGQGEGQDAAGETGDAAEDQQGGADEDGADESADEPAAAQTPGG